MKSLGKVDMYVCGGGAWPELACDGGAWSKLACGGNAWPELDWLPVSS